MTRASLTAICLLLAACGSGRATLLVDVRTDLQPGVDFVGVRADFAEARLRPGDSGDERAQIFATSDQDFIRGTRVAEFSDVRPGTRWVRVSLLDATGVVVADRLTAVRVRGDVGIFVSITRDCVGVSCPGTGDPAELSTCRAGRCVDPACDAGEGAACTPPPCALDSECVGTIRCAPGRCVSGECFYVADDGLCPADASCDAARGCASTSPSFGDDPPPAQCLEDGGMGVPLTPPGGTLDCPDDNHKQGCPCEPVGTMASCWPGRRVNRDRGWCVDGTTRCEASPDGSGRWSACAGALLPDPTMGLGPAACQCFSAGSWVVDSTNICFALYPGSGAYGVSSYLSGGTPRCPAQAPSSSPPPTPQPGTDWSTNRLTVDCEGRYRLCMTVKAGDPDAPSTSDCTVARSCTEDWYAARGVEQEFPPLPSWFSTDGACSQQLLDSGGYGEMSVTGMSIECDVVDGAAGAELVFKRSAYCTARCTADPSAAGCPSSCATSNSGDF
ncbi:MAG: hypothetical protein GXP55_22130 [Deltaproteobacteria bacterium]|nr:hypothetical protein [Deltaproteobacteria bacterium]